MKIDFESTLEEKVYFSADHINGCYIRMPDPEMIKKSGKDFLMEELGVSDNDLITVSEDKHFLVCRLPEHCGTYLITKTTFDYERGENEVNELHFGGIMSVDEVVDFFIGTWDLSDILVDPFSYGRDCIKADSEITWAKLILGIWENLLEKDFDALDEDEQEAALSAVERAKKILEK